MKTQPPVQVVAATILIVLVAIGSFAVWTFSATGVGGGLRAVADYLAHPRFSVPLAIELLGTVTLAIIVFRGWCFARVAVIVAVALWLPDLLPSEARSGAELNYPLGPWFAAFAVTAHAAALALLLSKPAKPWFETQREYVTRSDA